MSRTGNYTSKLVDMEFLYFQKNTSELRQGNYILQAHLKTENIVLGIKPGFILTDCKVADGVWVGDMLYSPIPLTEDWLLRGGLEPRGNEFFKKYTEREEFVLIVDKENYYVAEYDECYGFQAVYQPLLYVHQLQNVIHALTGQELEFKYK